MSKIIKLLGSMACSPILWGVAMTFLLYAPIRSGEWNEGFVGRVLGGHESAQLVTCLFLVGTLTVILRMLGVAAQRRLQNVPLLDAIPSNGQPLAECGTLLDRLDGQPATTQDTYLVRRLRETLEYIYRKNSADTIEDEMRHLAAVDRMRLQSDYISLRRWCVAIVAVGLMGGAFATADATAANANWIVAGDVFGLGLALATALLFVLQWAERSERQLITAVDLRVSAELVGRFEPSFNPATDPQVSFVRGMGEQVIRSSEQLATAQASIWKATFTEAQRQWSDWSSGATKQLEIALATSLAATMQNHAATLADAAKQIAEQNANNWREIQLALLQNAEAVTLQQRELVRQGEMLTQVVAATGQVEKLEAELNRNLSTLAEPKNFEQTVLSLGAAIQLLNSKLGAVPTPETPKVELKAKRGKAA